jgi:GNAT superfamily N-acetyltransferase
VVSQIHYREASIADLPKLLAFEQGVVAAERPFNEEIKDGQVHYYDLANLIGSDESLVIVAEVDDELVGTGHATLKDSKRQFKHDRHAYLGLMFVEPAHRGKGVIHRIIDELLIWARSRGVADFYLDVYAENKSAVSAYEKFGFTPNLVEMYLSD